MLNPQYESRDQKSKGRLVGFFPRVKGMFDRANHGLHVCKTFSANAQIEKAEAVKPLPLFFLPQNSGSEHFLKVIARVRGGDELRTGRLDTTLTV